MQATDLKEREREKREEGAQSADCEIGIDWVQRVVMNRASSGFRDECNQITC